MFSFIIFLIGIFTLGAIAGVLGVYARTLYMRKSGFSNHEIVFEQIDMLNFTRTPTNLSKN